jgi:hypothetical protein
MAKDDQGNRSSEREISVDLSAADPSKAVTRRAKNDISDAVRDTAGARGTDHSGARTKAEKDMFKRMSRLERNLTQQFDQRQAARDAEHQRELSAMRERLDKVQVDRSGDDAADAAHEAAIGALKDQLAAAYEKGDSAASADITLKISKLDAQFWAKKAQAAGVVQRDAPADKGKGAPQGEQPNARAGKGPTVAGSRFIKANEDWWDDPAYEIEQAAANTIFLRLVNEEGFDAKSDETFKEVAKQVKAKFPDLEIRGGRDDPEDDPDAGAGDEGDDARQRDNRGAPRRQAAAASLQDRGPAGNRDRNLNRRTLTDQEIQTMRDCRLDPDNDRDVVQFLKEAIALDKAQA